MHKAIVPLMEELETIDWYNQRIDACQDDELSAILAHNRDEEKENFLLLRDSLHLPWLTPYLKCCSNSSVPPI
jgi:hypothetical protein